MWFQFLEDATSTGTCHLKCLIQFKKDTKIVQSRVNTLTCFIQKEVNFFQIREMTNGMLTCVSLLFSYDDDNIMCIGVETCNFFTYKIFIFKSYKI